MYSHDRPKISIVMPSFNQADYLGEAIDSVFNQQYPNVELIVIDGGSTDESVNILESYSERLSHWISEPDEGQSQALNKGFRLATGEVIGWLNSDDSYQPGVLDHVAEVFADPDIDVAMCSQFGLMDAAGRIFDYKENRFDDHATLVRYWATNGMTINQPSVFIRRNILDGMDALLDEALHYAMDYDLWLRITRDHSIHVVEGHWANYRFHEASKSGLGFEKFFPEWQRVSRRYWGVPWSRKWLGHALSYAYHRFPLRLWRGALRRLKGEGGHG